MLKTLGACALALTGAFAAPDYYKRFSEPKGASNLTIDLDYAIYQGYKNETTGLNIWKGIRYAAAPTGDLRWKEPETPETSRNVAPATTFGPNCPQAFPASPGAPPFLPPGNEDCLFLNVYAPPTGGKKLPVLVWIHGGGYGLGDGTQDLSEIIQANEMGFVGVTIQYRLGAFGFLSSDEVKENGVVNAGVLDMAFALDWVQKHVGKFGGDPNKVTISGESAGGGAVMLLSIAKEGKFGTTLFQNGIAASPYLPPQYDYNASIPTQRYYDLASRVGCGNSGAVLECLRKADSATLQTANYNITVGGVYGTWAYLPVTDYTFIASLPSVALHAKRVNGESILVGNNANEGPLFVAPNITTLEDLKAWMGVIFPTIDDAGVQQVLNAYPSSDEPVDPNDPKFATDGVSPPTAINVSQVATGQQQRAYNIYAEATFVCPSYWLNNAYSPAHSYHYQYSVPFASHADDVTAYFGPSAPNQPPMFSLAFRRIWGNFIRTANPSIESEVATKEWPRWVEGEKAELVNLNTTGGVSYTAVTFFGANVTQFMDPGVQNKFTVANAWEWEGGRGKRCDSWRTMTQKIPV